tara:strand:+ start:587 stop:1168 length:582 start_codon:yes stop_codon:yes gene_type:complete
MFTPDFYRSHEDYWLQHTFSHVSECQTQFDFRTSIDSWFGYLRGGAFLSRNGRPHWFNAEQLVNPPKRLEATRSMHFISNKALAIIESDLRPANLVKDHAVPCLVLLRELKQMRPTTKGEVERFLKDKYRVGVITRDEDRALNLCGLRQAMPPHDGLLARYVAAKISGVEPESPTRTYGPRERCGNWRCPVCI